MTPPRRRLRIDPPHQVSPDAEPEPMPVLALKTGVKSIVPREAWKLWGMIGLALLGWLGVLSLGLYVDLARSEWSAIVGLQAGRTSRWYGAVCLLAAAQLSFLIFWHRSRSRKDFWGRYRIWLWAGLTWFTFCAAEVTSFHLKAAEWVAEQYRLRVWNAQTMCWMLAAAPIAVGMQRLLRREMQHCRASASLLRASMAAAVVSAATTFLSPLLPVSSVTSVMTNGSAMLWQLLLAGSVLIHTRFVIHITNEAAPKTREPKAGRIARWSAAAGDASWSLVLRCLSLGLVMRLVSGVGRGLFGYLAARKESKARRRAEWEATADVRRAEVDKKAAEKQNKQAAREAARAEAQAAKERAAQEKQAAREAEQANRAAEREAQQAAREAERETQLAAKAQKDRLAREAAEKDAAMKASAQAAQDAKARADAEAKAQAEARSQAARKAAEEKSRAEALAAEQKRKAEAEQAAAKAKADGAARVEAMKAQERAKAEAARAKAEADAEEPIHKGQSSAPKPHLFGAAIKPQHVSFDDGGEGDEEEDGDTRNLSKKERKRLKKMRARADVSE
jgi:hypothetical protein